MPSCGPHLCQEQSAIAVIGVSALRCSSPNAEPRFPFSPFASAGNLLKVLLHGKRERGGITEQIKCGTLALCAQRERGMLQNLDDLGCRVAAGPGLERVEGRWCKPRPKRRGPLRRRGRLWRRALQVRCVVHLHLLLLVHKPWHGQAGRRLEAGGSSRPRILTPDRGG